MGEMSFYGAMDLSSLKNKPSQNSTQNLGNAGETSAVADVAGLIVDVTSQNLNTVLEASVRVPVIMIFYATSAPTSLQLRDTLQNLATQYGGKFQLAQVATDEQVEIAQAFGISALPATVAFLQGQPIPLFQGVPEHKDIVQTIDQVLVAAKKYGIDGVIDTGEVPTEEPILSPLLQQTQTALEAKDYIQARETVTQALKENPNDMDAKSLLAQVELMQRIAVVNPDDSVEVAQQLLTELKNIALTDIDKQLLAADIETRYGRPDAAFGRLIDVVKVTAGVERDSARKHLLSLFEVVGSHNELVATARKELTNALF